MAAWYQRTKDAIAAGRQGGVEAQRRHRANGLRVAETRRNRALAADAAVREETWRRALER